MDGSVKQILDILALAGILILASGCMQRNTIVNLTVVSKSESPDGVYSFSDGYNNYQTDWLTWRQLETGKTYPFFEANGQMNIYNRCIGNTDCLDYSNLNVSPPTTEQTP
jgi:hypothetical protein